MRYIKTYEGFDFFKKKGFYSDKNVKFLLPDDTNFDTLRELMLDAWKFGDNKLIVQNTNFGYEDETTPSFLDFLNIFEENFGRGYNKLHGTISIWYYSKEKYNPKDDCDLTFRISVPDGTTYQLSMYLKPKDLPYFIEKYNLRQRDETKSATSHLVREAFEFDGYQDAWYVLPDDITKEDIKEILSDAWQRGENHNIGVKNEREIGKQPTDITFMEFLEFIDTDTDEKRVVDMFRFIVRNGKYRHKEDHIEVAQIIYRNEDRLHNTYILSIDVNLSELDHFIEKYNLVRR